MGFEDVRTIGFEDVLSKHSSWFQMEEDGFLMFCKICFAIRAAGKKLKGEGSSNWHHVLQMMGFKSYDFQLHGFCKST